MPAHAPGIRAALPGGAPRRGSHETAGRQLEQPGQDQDQGESENGEDDQYRQDAIGQSESRQDEFRSLETRERDGHVARRDAEHAPALQVLPEALSQSRYRSLSLRPGADFR